MLRSIVKQIGTVSGKELLEFSENQVDEIKRCPHIFSLRYQVDGTAVCLTEYGGDLKDVILKGDQRLLDNILLERWADDPSRYILGLTIGMDAYDCAVFTDSAYFKFNTDPGPFGQKGWELTIIGHARLKELLCEA